MAYTRSVKLNAISLWWMILCVRISLVSFINYNQNEELSLRYERILMK